MVTSTTNKTASAKKPTPGPSAGDVISTGGDLLSNFMKIGALNSYAREVKTDYEFMKNQALVDEDKIQGNINLNLAMTGVSTDSFQDVLAEGMANSRRNQQEIERQEAIDLNKIEAEKSAAETEMIFDVVGLFF